LPKPDHDKLAAEIEGMQRELKNLQNTLADLVEAMITEDKTGPKKTKKLMAHKKKAQDKKQPLADEVVNNTKGLPKTKKKNNARSPASEQATFHL
jgi:Skp family chaperone for outer membrane proteins